VCGGNSASTGPVGFIFSENHIPPFVLEPQVAPVPAHTISLLLRRPVTPLSRPLCLLALSTVPLSSFRSYLYARLGSGFTPPL